MSGIIELRIIGSPRTVSDRIRLISRVHAKVLKVAPDAWLEDMHFANIRSRLIWTGKMVEVKYVDSLYAAAVKYAAEYTTEWEVDIYLMYMESEGD